MIVTDESGRPRAAWATFDRQRWLLIEGTDVSELLDRLRAEGIRQVTLLSRRSSTDLTQHLGAGVRVVAVDAWAQSQRWSLVVVDLD